MSENNNNTIYYNYGLGETSATFNRDSIVDKKIDELKGNAPENLDTIEELADAIQNSGGDVTGLVSRIDSLEASVENIESNTLTTNDVENIVNDEIDKLKGEVPETLDTLKEIADLLETKQDAAQVVEALGTKADTTYVDEQLALKADKSELPNMEDYVKTEDLPEIPDTSNFITMEDVEAKGYITETDADNKYQPKGEYLTEHQSLEGLATEEFVNNAIGEIDIPDVSNFITKNEADEAYQPKGEYLTEHQSLEGLATEEYVDNAIAGISIPDVSNFITKEDADDSYQPKGDYLTAQNIEGLASEEYVDNAVNAIVVPDVTDFVTKDEADEAYQPKGEYLTEEDIEGLATEEFVNNAVNAIIVPENVSEFNNDAGYLTAATGDERYYEKEAANSIFVAKSEFEDAIGLKADKSELEEYATQDSLETTVYDLVRRLNKLEATNNYLIENATESADEINNMSPEDAANADITVSSDDAIEALSTPKTFKSINVVGGEVGNETVITLKATDDVNVTGLTVSGVKGNGNGKINFATNEININSVDINPGCTVYNVFEGSQDKTSENSIDKFTATNIVVNDTDLRHNVFNIYQFNDDATVLIKDSSFNLNVANSNVLRVSNITNAKNVTITFENVDWTYENVEYTPEDAMWAGLMIYQPYGSDSAFTGDTSNVGTWTINVKNCRYNGEPVTENFFGTIRQAVYQYNINNNGICQAPVAFDKVNFIND